MKQNKIKPQLDRYLKSLIEMVEKQKLSFAEIAKNTPHAGEWKLEAEYKKACLFRSILENHDFDYELKGLSLRAVNALYYAKITTKKELVKKFYNGDLHRIRNFGKGCIDEVKEWLGDDMEYGKPPVICPHCGKAI